MRSDNKIIQGLIEAADDSNEWWQAWQMVGAYFRKHWAREQEARQRLATALAAVVQAKEIARQNEALARQRANYITSRREHVS